MLTHGTDNERWLDARIKQQYEVYPIEDSKWEDLATLKNERRASTGSVRFQDSNRQKGKGHMRAGARGKNAFTQAFT